MNNRTMMAKALLEFKADLTRLFDQNPDADITGFTFSAKLDGVDPIMQHLPCATPAHDLAVIATILSEIGDDVAMEYIPLLKALKLIITMGENTPTYLIIAENHARATSELFACAPPSWVQIAHEHLGRVLQGQSQNTAEMERLNKEYQEKNASQNDKTQTDNVIPFPTSPTKH